MSHRLEKDMPIETDPKLEFSKMRAAIFPIYTHKLKRFVPTFLILISCLCFQDAFAEIIKAPNLSPIKKVTQQADSNTLVIFDVGDVLVTPKDQILQTSHQKFAEKIEKEMESRYSAEEVQVLQSIIWMARSAELVDKKLIKLIRDFQKRGIKVMALTNLLTGSFGNMSSPENWRVKELEGFGYTFKNSWTGVKSKTFEELKSKDPKRFPVFKNGVLFTCGLPKGPVLKAFLQYAGFSPKKIIFIDDRRDYLESVEAFSKEEGIPFIGFEYTAIADRPKSPLNIKRTRLQFEILEKEHKWFSDEEMDRQEDSFRKRLCSKEMK
jgi:uncharacterized protein DUF2608